MKIVITTDCFLPRWDGIARFLSLLLPELTKYAQVTVFAPKFPGKTPVMKGVRIIRFPLINIRFGDIHFSKPEKTTMEKHIKEADIVFNQTIGPVGQAGINIANKLKKPTISYIHSIEWELAKRAIKRPKFMAEWLIKVMARRLYNKCTLLLVPSNEVADLLSGNKITTKKEIVRLGVPVKIFAPPKSKTAAKEKIGLAGRRIIGFCGRIAREKDLPTLHQAFQTVHNKYKHTTLLIVGEGLEEEIPASRNIIRAGRRDNPVPYLQAMDIFVLPSLTETSSLATMEAMAVGLPVIVTPVGNIREYVVHKKNGLIFARQDVKELTEHLIYLLKHPKIRKQLGKEARNTIIKDYSWKKTAEKIKKTLLTFSN
ncbi:glycosyltransferase family 4 protein [Candidatus Woesearchaeota archaeon]|nr:glycosyltransferase family 4 protein [Candidatus Woesearchaeota archaeon]